MDVKLGDIFAGRASGSGKPKHYGFVDWTQSGITQQRSRRRSRCRYFARQGSQRCTGLKSGYANDGYGAWRPTG